MENCIFCKIVRGEIPSTKVYEDDTTLAFLDIHPVNPGHTLVISKHPEAQNIFDVTPVVWAEVMETTRKVAIAIEKGTGADGVNIMMNNREHAGQLVTDHLHIHIIPRFNGDGLRHWSQKTYAEGEAQAVAEKIQKAL